MVRVAADRGVSGADGGGNIVDQTEYKCHECGSPLSRMKASTKFEPSGKVETQSITPCSHCIDKALADRGAFALVQSIQTGTTEDGEDTYMYVLAWWNVFFTKNEAHRKLTELIEQEEQDITGKGFNWDEHRVLELDRRGVH